MTIAEIHGKSPWSNSEDFLTADVFTAFRYLPSDPGLVGFLRSVSRLGKLLPWANIVKARIHFWPIGALLGREPDLLLELAFDERIVHVVVEAKYHAGPSDKDNQEMTFGDQTVNSGRQLVDQFLDLSHGYYTVFQASTRDRQLMLRSEQADRYLLYLTAHPVRPEAELAAVVDDHSEMAGRLFWASFYQVFEYLQNLRLALTQFPFDRVLADICLLLERKGFFTFHGFNAPLSIREKNTDFIFWQDVRPGQIVFKGFRRPPQLNLATAASVFWQAQEKDDSID